MAVNLYLVGYMVICCLAAVSAANDDFTSMLMRHIDTKIKHMEVKHSVQIQTLEDKLQHQKADYTYKIAELEQRLIRVEATNEALSLEKDGLRTSFQGNISEKLENYTPRRDDPYVDDSKDTQTNSETKPQEGIKVGNDKPNIRSPEITRPRKAVPALLDGYNVAFSAYMDYDVDGLGPGQTLIYNQVLLNDGNGYNKHSGIFTAPMAGVYSFSFFIGQRDNHDEWVALWVNSANKVDAAVQTMHTTQDLQGGNTVNLKLALGDIVFVKNIGDGHVEGSDGLRLTTFSGFLLYPISYWT